MIRPEKTYLSDGAYVQLDEWRNYILTTEDGNNAQNTVVLSHREMKVLKEFEKQVETWVHQLGDSS